MGNKNILKMPEEYFQNADVNDDDLLTSEEENARKEVADYMENHYMEECRDDYKNNSSTSKNEEEKNDPFMTGLAVVCGTALLTTIASGISCILTNRKINKVINDKNN